MNKLVTIVLTVALLVCGLAAFAEESPINCGIEDGSYVIRIPDENGDLGWVADEMAQDDSVVRLAKAELEDGAFVVQYDPVGDGEVSVYVKHYTGIACDQMHGWDLKVENGAVVECTGGSYTASPDPSDSDPYLIGAWQTQDGAASMTIGKNPGGADWDVEIEGTNAEGAYIFKTTIRYDCELNGFVYDKGKFWDAPADGDELGEAKVAGTTGMFTFTGDDQHLQLGWVDDADPEQELTFHKDALVDYGASEIYPQADMDEAIALIMAEFDTWEGCEMHAIRYAGDESADQEHLDYARSLNEEADFAECIQFVSDFHSPVEGGGAWEADQEYTDWQWILARPEGGSWELLTWGY